MLQIIKILVVYLLMLVPTCAFSQDKLELGLFLGGSYYLGDLNPDQQFKDTRPAIGVFCRYAVSDRWAVKVNAIGAGIAGEYPSGGNIYLGYEKNSLPDDDNKYPSYDFKRVLVDVGVTGEFNFVSYDHMFFKKKTKFTPYLALGLAMTSFESYSKEIDGKQRFVLSLPFGIGAKYKLNQWLRLGFEWTMRKTFVDDLDLVGDVSGKVNPSNPYGLGKPDWTHNNDWYSLVGVTVSISMWPRSLECYDGAKLINR